MYMSAAFVSTVFPGRLSTRWTLVSESGVMAEENLNEASMPMVEHSSTCDPEDTTNGTCLSAANERSKAESLLQPNHIGNTSAQRRNSVADSITDSKPETYDEVKSRQPKHCCVICRKRCWAGCLRCCRPCLTDFNPLPHNPSSYQRFKYALMCPPHGRLARFLTLFSAVLFIWGVLWGITGPEALPGGNFFALLILVVSCSVAGKLVELIKLPALLGKL